ncbi:hypothetical protein LXL04_007235 [Taraxacum kok-saghyz]
MSPLKLASLIPKFLVVLAVGEAVGSGSRQLGDITDSVDIISDLDTMEKKLSNDHDDTSVTGDSSTPISYIIKNSCKTPAPKVKINNTNPVAKELKRKLTEIYDVDAPEFESATKNAATPVSKSKETPTIKLLIPKVTKNKSICPVTTCYFLYVPQLQGMVEMIGTL